MTNMGTTHSNKIVDLPLTLEDPFLHALPLPLRRFIQFECELPIDSTDAYRLWMQGEPWEYLLEQVKKFSRMQHMATYPGMEAKRDAVHYTIYPAGQQGVPRPNAHSSINTHRF